MSNLYSQYKICGSCGYEDQREVSAEIAAFEERRKWNEACPKCGSLKVTASGEAIPEPTKELMEIWSKDDSLSFYEQDEDICLAEEDNLELLLEFLDSNKTLPSKRSILLSTLCILVHDNVPEEEDDPDIKIELANKVAGELKKRMDLFVELDTSLIMDYIKELAYPRIGVPITNM